MFIAGVVVVDVYVDFNVAGGAAAIVFCCLHEKRTYTEYRHCSIQLVRGGVFKLFHVKLKIQRNTTVCHIPYL